MSEYLETFQVPHPIMEKLPFDLIWKMKPEQRGKVWHNNHNIDAHRFYKSYGTTPKFDESVASYMFSSGESTQYPEIPDVFHELMDHIGTHSNQTYNNLVINWYEDGQDYTPIHKDCLDGMLGSNICIVNIVDGPLLRDFVLIPGDRKAHIHVQCSNGLGIVMKKEALDRRHGVPKVDTDVSRRISLSFRTY